MKVPIGWLSEYVQPEGDFATGGGAWEIERLADRLVMTGTEIEAVQTVGPTGLDSYVVGRVLGVEDHPDADRLSVCRVDTGDGDARTIVCGAPNVREGQSVPVALPGAVLPDGMTIKAARLRGVESNGMILSEQELGIGHDGSGIMVLGGEGRSPEPGMPLSGVVPIADTVLELEVTPNRPDCLGIYGVAREVHAATEAALTAPPWKTSKVPARSGPISELASVTVEVPELCPRFTATAFTEVSVGPSPAWLKARLAAAGQRSINNVVDVTNYVMMVTGQPLHAFDLDRVSDSRLTVRESRVGESMVTLDGEERGLPDGTVVVCDSQGPAAIAGIMGGGGSEVTATTNTVLLEVANWSGPDILRSSRDLALRTEASARFEKQLHPGLCDRAQRMAGSLLVELCGAKQAEGMIDVDAGAFRPRRVDLRLGRAQEVLGMEVPEADQIRYLERLGCSVEQRFDEQHVVRVGIPIERYFDLTREADLVEEVGRIHGLEKLVPSLPAISGSVEIASGGGLSRTQTLRRVAEDHVRSHGFDEVVGWSFTDPDEPSRLGLDGTSRVRLANPLSADQSEMRVSLLGSLLNAASLNAARGAERIALFESGRVYGENVDGVFENAMQFPGVRHQAPAAEIHRLAALAAGPIVPGGWDGRREAGGFFALKGILESLGRRLRVDLQFVADLKPFLHPGRSATVSIPGIKSPLGWIGEVHPSVCAKWDLEEAVGFEIDLMSVLDNSPAGRELFEDVPDHPAVHQDLAVVVTEATAASQVLETVLAAGRPLLRSADAFDLFRGEQVGGGYKSLALRLEFQALDRTLTDDEVSTVRKRIEEELHGIGGSVRG